MIAIRDEFPLYNKKIPTLLEVIRQSKKRHPTKRQVLAVNQANLKIFNSGLNYNMIDSGPWFFTPKDLADALNSPLIAIMMLVKEGLVPNVPMGAREIRIKRPDFYTMCSDGIKLPKGREIKGEFHGSN